MRIPQELDAFGWNPEWLIQNESADSVGRNNNRDQRQKRVVDKSSRVDGHFVKAKQEGNCGGENCMKTEEWRKGNEDADGKSKRRPLGWIIQGEQTAKGRTQHRKGVGYRVSGVGRSADTPTPDTWRLLKAAQSFRFVVVRVEHSQELGDNQKVLNLLRQVQ